MPPPARAETNGAEPDAAALRAGALAGVRLIAASRVVAELLAFAISVVLARLIPPAEFGRAAIVLIVQALATILTYEGFGSVLVQRREVSRGLTETSMVMSILFGAVLSAATFLLADPVFAPVFDERTAYLLKLIAPSFLLASVCVVARSMLQRNLDFKGLTMAEVVSVAVGALTAVGLALAGFDGEAIVGGSLVTTALAAVVLLVHVPPVRPRLHRKHLRELVSFGVPASIAGLTFTARRNVDYAILGARLSATQVGIYWRAFQLGVEYQAKLSSITQRVAFPTLARAPSRDDMRKLRSAIARSNALFVFPLLALFVALAPDLIPTLYGPAWEGAVVPAQILAVAGVASVMLSGVEAVALAAGRPGALMAFNGFFLAAYAAAIYAATSYSLTVIACVAAAVHILMVLVAYAGLFKPLAGIPIRTLWDDTRAALVASAVLLAIALPLAAEVRDLGLPLATMAITGIAGTCGYVVCLRLLFGAEWRSFVGLAARLVKRPKQPAARPAAPVTARPSFSPTD